MSEERDRAVQLVNDARRQDAEARLGALRAAINRLAPGTRDVRRREDEIDRSPREAADLLERRLEELLDYPSRRLAVYGTLAPGQVNHHVVADIPGRWTRGWVRGDLGTIGPYPALRWNPRGARVPVHVLQASQLARHWSRLERFEGSHYRRILAVVALAGGGLIVANLFEGVLLD